MSGQGEGKDPWSDLARQLGEDAAKGGAGAAAGEALEGWTETKPFLPGEEKKPRGPRKLGDGDKTRPRITRDAADAAKAARSGKEATSIVGKVLAVVAAHTFLAGAAIVVSVLAFGATGVALLKSTEEKSRDEVATVDIGGGDKSGADASDPDAGSSSSDPSGGGVRGQAGDDGTGKPTTPTDPPPTDPGSTTTSTTRPRVTPTPTPGAPIPPDPTPDPPPQPTPTPHPAPSIGSFSRSQGQICGDQRSRAVTFNWSSTNGDSATLSVDGAVVASGLPASGSHTIACVNRVGALIGSTWHLRVSGPGGTADSNPDLRITQASG